MALDPGANFSKSTLSTGYASGATTLVLTTGGGAKFPAPSFNAVSYASGVYADPSDDPNVEIIRVTGVSTNTLTVTRAQEGTSAANHNTAGHTYTLVAGPTSKLLTDILGISITGSAATVTGAAQTAITSVGTLSGLTVTAAPTFSALTLGSVPFASTAGLIAQDNANLFYDATNHRLGIGTTTPALPLDVHGVGGTIVNITASTGTNAILCALNNTSNTTYFGNESSVAGTSITGSLAYASLFGASTSAKPTQIIAGGAVVATFLSSGNVGVGVVSPVSMLDVVASVSNSSVKAGSIEMQSYNTTNAWIGFNGYYNGSNFLYRDTNPIVRLYNLLGDLRIGTAPSGTAGATATMTERLTVLNTGNVGIGTTAPTSQLQIGASFGLGTTGANSSWLADNLYYSSGWYYTTTAPGSLIFFNGGDFQVNSCASGTAAAAATFTTKLTVSNLGNVVIGSGALATNATDGFLYVPTCAGTPTGTPTAYTGRIPLVFDSTNKYLYFYLSGWKKSTIYA